MPALDHPACRKCLCRDDGRRADLGARRRRSGIVGPHWRPGIRPAIRFAPRSGATSRSPSGRSPDYLARHPRPAKPQDLHAHDCIRLRFPSGAFAPWRFAIGGKDGFRRVTSASPLRRRYSAEVFATWVSNGPSRAWNVSGSGTAAALPIMTRS